MAVLKARTEFASALNQICAEHGIEIDVVLNSIKEALLAAYRRDFGMNEKAKYEAEVDPQTGETHLFLLEEKGRKEITPPGFGRIAAQVAKQVLIQKIREAEKTSILDEYAKRVGNLVTGRIIRFDGPNIIVDIDRTEAIMPKMEQVASENYKIGQRLTFYIKGIEELGKGRQIVVSRADKDLVGGLFKREVPEVASGVVKIKEIAREAGSRSKIAVFSTQTGVDPVGSCVGQKGVRVQAVINELNGEKIDIIQYSEDPAKFIAASLSPAEKVKVEVDQKKKTALVTVPEDQLSLAIGKDGQNVRLAVKLTGYKIDIQGFKETVTNNQKIKEKTEKVKVKVKTQEKTTTKEKAKKGKKEKKKVK
jgi:N utilization substance protein A